VNKNVAAAFLSCRTQAFCDTRFRNILIAAAIAMTVLFVVAIPTA
jgi:hypothetical protein